jgi:RHS repeat-associated protein
LTTSVTYDLQGVLSGQNVAQTSSVVYDYDAAGNRRQMSDGLGTVSYEYDQLSRLKTETRQFNTTLPQSPLPNNSFRLSYAYNLANELTSVTNPFGSQVGYSYDLTGKVTAVTGSGSVSAASYVNNVLYRAWGAAKQVSYGNNRTLSASYDNRLRLTRWDVAGVLGYQYSYNYFNENSGRVTFASQLYDHTQDRSYDYDQVSRLAASYTGTAASAHIGTGSTWGNDGPYAQTTAYDQWGNVVGRNGWGGVNAQYSYNPQFASNKMTVNPVTGAVVQYDAAGDLTNDGSQTFGYEATGQQVSASSTGLQQRYDGDGLRIRKTENGQTTYYLRSTVLGQQVVTEANGSGAFNRGYVYLNGQLLALQDSNGVSWVHQDPITKSQRLTNSAGSIVSWIELDPWGGETGGSSNSQQQPHRFTSYERDSNGSDEAMMRRYEGKWSRFAQPDPYDGSYNLSDPQSLNRYAYTESDPVNLTDASGLTDETPACTPTVDPATGQIVCVPNVNGGTVTISSDPTPISWDDLPGAGGRGSLNRRQPLTGSIPEDGDGPQGNCGVNPITGQPGFSNDPKGVPGNLRPGSGGEGYFGARRRSNPRGHQGLDISGISGQSAVYANRAGTARVSYGPVGGNAVYIDHGDGVVTSYFHLSSVTIRPGPVSQGQQIGVVGQTGNASRLPPSEAHVHFGAAINGVNHDPATYLNSPCPPAQTQPRRRRG